MSQKQIRKGDIVRVRYNNISGHQFKENTLGVVLEVWPKWVEFPKRFKVATRTDWWYVDIADITLFSRNNNEEDDY